MFDCLGEVEHLNSAINYQQEAVELTPFDNPEQPGHLYNLGHSYQIQFEQFGEVKDLDIAIKHLQDAVHSTPPDSTYQSRYLNKLGVLYQKLFDQSKEEADIVAARSIFFQSSQSMHGLPHSCIFASIQCANIGWLTNDLTSAAEAYDQVVHLLPRVAWLGFDASAQLNQLTSDIQDLGCDAAACRIALAQLHPHEKQQHLGRAIELLDQGRSVLWSQASSFRQDLAELKKVDEHLAGELDLVGKSLAQGYFQRPGEVLSEKKAQLYRHSAERWDKLVQMIQKIPGFSQFLLPLPISTIQTSSAKGPVVIINSSKHRCDALIIPQMVTLCWYHSPI